MIPATTERVARHTAPHVNEWIRTITEASVGHYANQDEVSINRRLVALDREWDIERMLEANASSISLIGILLAATHSMWWLLLPAAVGIFLLQHAISGWCPPVPVLRRLGFRTASEIDEERYGLKLIRGDFDHLCRHEDRSGAHPHAILEAVRK